MKVHISDSLRLGLDNVTRQAHGVRLTDDVVEQVRFAHGHASGGCQRYVAEVHMEVVVGWLVVHVHTQLVGLHAVLLRYRLQHISVMTHHRKHHGDNLPSMEDIQYSECRGLNEMKATGSDWQGGRHIDLIFKGHRDNILRLVTMGERWRYAPSDPCRACFSTQAGAQPEGHAASGCPACIHMPS